MDACFYVDATYQEQITADEEILTNHESEEVLKDKNIIRVTSMDLSNDIIKHLAYPAFQRISPSISKYIPKYSVLLAYPRISKDISKYPA